jgi:hypothetical protein
MRFAFPVVKAPEKMALASYRRYPIEMLPATTKPIAHGDLSPSMRWRQWDLPYPPPPDFCQWAQEHGLFSKGSDFTSFRIHPGRPGNSMLRKLWQGKASEPEGDRLSVWTIHDTKDKPCGVVVWEHTSDTASSLFDISDRPHRSGQQWRPAKTAVARNLGRVSLWLDPSHRCRGWIRELLTQSVVPQLEHAARSAHARGEFPFLRSADATPDIMAKVTDIPQPGFVHHCLNEGEHLRSMIDGLTSGYSKHERWQVPWIPVPSISRARSMRR